MAFVYALQIPLWSELLQKGMYLFQPVHCLDWRVDFPLRRLDVRAVGLRAVGLRRSLRNGIQSTLAKMFKQFLKPFPKSQLRSQEIHVLMSKLLKAQVCLSWIFSIFQAFHWRLDSFSKTLGLSIGLQGWLSEKAKPFETDSRLRSWHVSGNC